MYTTFINSKLQGLCENADQARKKLGERCTKLLLLRMTQLLAADTLKILKTIPGARCHGLKGDRYGQYSLDLEHPKRLIILPTNGNDQEGKINEELVTEVVVIEIIDYH